MREEAREFDHRLQTFSASSLNFVYATERFFESLDPILRAPLPRVWTQVEGGLAEPVRASVSHEHGNTVGGDAAFGALEEARRELHSRVLHDVLSPIDSWRENLRVVEERIPELLRLQSTADSRWTKLRRTRGRFEKRLRSEREEEERDVTQAAGDQGGRGGRAGGNERSRNPLVACFTNPYDPYHEDEEGRHAYEEGVLEPRMARQITMEDASAKVSKKQRDFDAALEDFRQQEALVGSQLGGLNQDASWTKSYMASTLVLAKEAMQVGVVSLNKTKQPLPSFASRRCPDVFGAMRDNTDLAAALPEGIDLRRVMPTREPAGGLLLPTTVHAHRAVAQPLETHARPDVSGLDRVATPPAGATDLALSATRRAPAEAAPLGGAAAAAAAPGRPVAPAVGAALAGAAEPSVGASFERREGERASWASREPEGLVGAGVRPTVTTAGPMGATPMGGARVGQATSERSVYEEERRVEQEMRRRAEEERLPAVPHHRRLGAEAEGGLGGGVGERVREAVERMVGAPAGGEDVVCGRQEFTQVEERPLVKERVERVMEHRPVEKEFITETKFVGEHAGAVATPETRVGPVHERVVGEAAPGPKAPRHFQEGAAGAAPVETM